MKFVWRESELRSIDREMAIRILDDFVFPASPYRFGICRPLRIFASLWLVTDRKLVPLPPGAAQ
jgi:hypothetical protein